MLIHIREIFRFAVEKLSGLIWNDGAPHARDKRIDSKGSKSNRKEEIILS